MGSIQDLVNAAYQIRESATEVQLRAQQTAGALQSHRNALATVVRGSRSGEYAVQQMNLAERSVLDCAAKLNSLNSNINNFINDLAK